MDQHLSVRKLDVAACNWSGGFPIDKVDSFHVNMRAESNVCTFLRVEVLLQGATFYIVFTDADQMPPPFRIDNFSEVSVMYYQTNATDGFRTMIKPWTSVDYAWDEPTLPPYITCSITGGTSATYNLNALGDGDQLIYENFIYITFQSTFDSSSSSSSSGASSKDPSPPISISSSRKHLSTTSSSSREHHRNLRLDSLASYDKNLVLDLVDNTRVVLAPKENGKRSQLWRMDGKGQLIHEGSSPPRDPRRPGTSSGGAEAKLTCFVLDIADTAMRPNEHTPLTIRRPEKRRESTQTWYFTDDGRLRLKKVQNLVVQVKDADSRGVRSGAEVVLGPIPKGCHSTKNIPMEMNIGRERMRPGSGFLAVRIIPDGPTRVLQITDIRNRNVVATLMTKSTSAGSSIGSPGSPSDGWMTVDEELTKKVKSKRRKESLRSEAPAQTFYVDLTNEIKEFSLLVNLSGGVGLSAVNSADKIAEELIYMTIVNLELDYLFNSTGQYLDLRIGNIQIDNQLFGSSRPVLLKITQTDSKSKEEMPPLSPDATEASESLGAESTSTSYAIQVIAQKQHAPKHRPLQNVEIYNNLMITIKRLSIQLEEKLLWKMLGFLGWGDGGNSYELDADTEDGDLNAQLQAATSAQAKRFYFGQIKIITSRIKLSMLTANKLPPELGAIKEYWGIPMVRFEDALVDLDPFVRIHPFETSAFLVDSILKHYEVEFKSQAAKILGSIDFLGNPLGLFNDITDGISGLVKHGNVGGLLTNVTHGVSDSAAKVTGSLSDGLGAIVMDDKHMEIRESIRRTRGAGTGEHLMTGIKGLGFGIMAGLTSVITQSYEGVSNNGVEGLISGFGKGVIGTVTKPALGILDFATGAAASLRDSARGGSGAAGNQVVRPTRVCQGPGGLLPRYCMEASRGQSFLHILNDFNYEENYISHEELRGPPDNISALISSDHIYILRKSKSGSASDRPVLQKSYAEIYQCSYLNRDNRHYIHLVYKTARPTAGTSNSAGGGGSRTPPLPHSQTPNRQQIRCETQHKAETVVHHVNYAKTLFEEKLLMITPISRDLTEDNDEFAS